MSDGVEYVCGPAALRVLRAVLVLDRPTVRAVCDEAGLASTSTAHVHLKQATLRAMVRAVPFGTGER